MTAQLHGIGLYCGRQRPDLKDSHTSFGFHGIKRVQRMWLGMESEIGRAIEGSFRHVMIRFRVYVGHFQTYYYDFCNYSPTFVDVIYILYIRCM